MKTFVDIGKVPARLEKLPDKTFVLYFTDPETQAVAVFGDKYPIRNQSEAVRGLATSLKARGFTGRLVIKKGSTIK
jgi:hypothetical protein